MAHVCTTMRRVLLDLGTSKNKLVFPSPPPLPPPPPPSLSRQDPTAVQSALEQNFGSVDLPPAGGSKAAQGGSTTAASAEPLPAAFSTDAEPSERDRELRTSKKRKMPSGRLDSSSGVAAEIGEAFAESKPAGGGEAQCGRRGWLPEEDERLRQVRRALRVIWCGHARGRCRLLVLVASGSSVCAVRVARLCRSKCFAGRLYCCFSTADTGKPP